MKLFRKTLPADLEEIMRIVNDAKAYMKRNGIDQWQDGYPCEQDYINDIEKGIAYVVEQDGEVVALSAVSFEHEADYDEIYDGVWLTDGEYGAIHRIAVKENLKGANIGGFIVENAVRMCREIGISSLRCDTHKDNLSMQRMLTKNAFTPCGKVFVSARKLPRIAFEKLI